MFHGSRPTLLLASRLILFILRTLVPTCTTTDTAEFNSDAVSVGVTFIFGIYLHLQIRSRSRTLRASPSHDAVNFQIHVPIKQDSADAVMRQKEDDDLSE